MPTIITHAAVPLALGFGLGRRVISGRLLLVGIAVSMLPDMDGLGYQFGIVLSGLSGHRGATHSLLFAVLVAACVGLLARYFGVKGWIVGSFAFVAIASHALLDMATTGGPGVALCWPWSDERMFLPFQVIEVSPMTLGRLMSKRGVDVLLSELVWVWLPCMTIVLALLPYRVHVRRRQGGPVGNG